MVERGFLNFSTPCHLGCCFRHTHQMHIPDSLHSLSSPEKTALRLDGEISSFDTPIDLPDDWRTRSDAILRRERWPMVLTSLSALWAHGFTEEPQKHSAAILPPKRVRAPQREGLRVEERLLSPVDYWLHRNHGVTTLNRTLFDVVKLKVEDWQAILPHIGRFLIEHPNCLNDVTERFLQEPKLPYRTEALSRLAVLSSLQRLDKRHKPHQCVEQH